MNTKTNKIISIIIIILFLFYSTSIALRYYQQDYRTEIPYVFDVSNEYATQGIIIRDEEECPKHPDGYISYIVPDGKKVIPTTVVARQYSDEKSLIIDAEVDKIQQIYQKVTDIEKTQKKVIKNIDSLNENIITSIKPFMELKFNSSAENINTIKFDILDTILTSKMMTGQQVNFDEIKNELDSYMSYGTQYNSITADFRGIFSSYVDGYEEKLSPKTLSSITFDNFEELMAIDYPRQEESFGKNIKNINWYYVTKVPTYASKIFQSVNKICMTVGNDRDNQIMGRVVNSIDDFDTDTSLIFIKSNEINSEVLGNRKININIGFQNFSGIRFSSKALRIVDGVQGVYVKGKSSITFKKVDIIYRGPDFYLTKLNYKNNEYLNIFDEVIVKGRNLYDGKEL